MKSGGLILKCGFCSTSNKRNSVNCKACGKPLYANRLTSRKQVKFKETMPPNLIKTIRASLTKNSKSKIWSVALFFLGITGCVFLFTTGIYSHGSGPGSVAKSGKLNNSGLPVSCDMSEIRTLAESILVNQLTVNGKIQIEESGYATSWIDVGNSSIDPVETSNSDEFAALTCNYSQVAKQGSPRVTIEFDSVAEPRSWRGSIDEQEIRLGYGEKLIVYYPSGGGFEYGGGVLWRVWVDEIYFEISTWSESPKIVNLPRNEFQTLINLLKKGEK